MRKVRQAVAVQTDPLKRQRCLAHIPQLWYLNNRRLKRVILVLRLREVYLGRNLALLRRRLLIVALGAVLGRSCLFFLLLLRRGLLLRLGQHACNLNSGGEHNFFSVGLVKRLSIVGLYATDIQDVAIVPPNLNFALKYAFKNIVNILKLWALLHLHFSFYFKYF